MQPTRVEGKTQYNQRQAGSSAGSRRSTQAQNESRTTTSNGESTSTSSRNLTSRTVASKSGGQKVNIGMQISFKIRIKSPTPVDPDTPASC